MSIISDRSLICREPVAARATITRSNKVVFSANGELSRHRLWMERHHELYSEALKACQRQLRRQNYINACKEVVLLPPRLLLSACVALLHGACAYPRRVQRRVNLQRRIYAIDDLCKRRAPEPAWRTAKKIA
jgi:hypothetical protein